MALFKIAKKLIGGLDSLLKDEKVLKIISPLPDIEKSKRFLFIGPHPDDIEIGAGATLAKLIKQGKEVKMLVCTDGGCGSADPVITAEEVTKTRLEESKNAAKTLGCDNFENIMFEDGGSYSEWELAKEIAKRIYEYDPDVILCPDPHLPTETHPDHLKCGRATCSALFLSGYRLVAERNGLHFDQSKIRQSRIIGFYYTHRANTFVEFDDKDQEKQLAAMKCHASQFPGLSAEGTALYLSLRAKRMGELSGVKQAEGFFVEAPMHQHCVSETNNW